MAIINGTTLSNILTGTSSADTIFGDSGNDILIGGLGADVLIGGINITITYTITNPAPANNDYFGFSLRADGNYAIVGTPNDDASFTDSGTAYIYNVTTGASVVTLNNPTAAASDFFGNSAGISGNYAIVGAPNDDTNFTNAGSAYIYNATTGSLLFTLNNPTGAANDYFGNSVSVSGNYAVITAEEDDTGASNAGSAYIYNVTTGALLYTLNNPSPTANDYFGHAVRVSGNYAVVSASSDDPSGVTDAGSVYVYNVTTGALVHTLNNPSPATSDFFGTSLAISGNYLAVGAPDDDAGASNSGTVYIYNVTTGALLRTITNPFATVNDYFGTSVSLSGNYLVVGTPNDDVGGTDTGTVYVYDVTTGQLIKTMSNPFSAVSDYFGFSTAISGNNIVISSYYDDVGGTNTGTIYTYTLSEETDIVDYSDSSFAVTVNLATNSVSGSHASSTAFGDTISGFEGIYGGSGNDYLIGDGTANILVGRAGNDTLTGGLGSDTLVGGISTSTGFTFNHASPAADDNFGNAVSVSGNYAIIGAINDNVGANADDGSVHIYNITTGSLLFTLTNPTPAASDIFGYSVAVSGNYAVVSSSDNTGASHAGSVYIYNATTGALLYTLNNPSPNAFGYFGFDVSVSGNYAIIGASANDTGATDAGVSYIYNVTTGALVYTLTNPTPVASDFFGRSVGISGNYAIVAASDDNTNATDAGAVYIYNVTTGALLYTLNNPTPVASDLFGFAVAISGNYAIVGSHQDDTGATDAGSAYIYDVTTGTLLYTLNNPTPVATDLFGASVDISGNYAVVGAYGDDTGATDAGAAYLYDVRTGQLLATITNPSPTTSDYFGYSVSISGNNVLVSAYYDDAGATNAGTVYHYTINEQTDTLDYSDSTNAVSIDLALSSVSGSHASSSAFGDTITGFENAVGGTGDDVLTSAYNTTLLSGGDGNDTLNGRSVHLLKTDAAKIYALAEGSGTTSKDYLTNTADITLQNGAIWGTNNQGVAALELAGATDNTGPRASVASMTIGGDITFSAYARFDNLARSWQRIFDFGQGQNDDNIDFGQNNNTSAVQFEYVNGSTAYKLVSSTGVLVAGQWAHWAVTLSATGLATIYKDGVQVAQTNHGVALDTVARTSNYIGASNWAGDDALDGSISDIAIYDRALSATEVSNLYGYVVNGNGLASNNFLVTNTAGTYNGGIGNDIITASTGNDVLIGGAGTDNLSSGDGNDILHGHSISQSTIDTLLAANPNIVWNASTNSFYQYVASTALWSAAKTAAEASMLNGIAGHLAVITSATEESYVYSLISNNNTWIGATDQVSEGVWLWVGGPENGMQFWQGVAAGSPVNNFYNNWGVTEPNDSGGEDYAQITTFGEWYDNKSTATFHYVIEWDAGLMSDDNLADTLSGGIGNDTIYAYGGADSVAAGDGNDIVIAAAGNDTVTGGLGSDVLDGGSGTDLLNYSDSTNAVTVNLATGSTTGSHASSTAFGDAITGFENLVGGSGNDTLTGDTTDNVLIGGLGTDNLSGGDGNDILHGHSLSQSTIDSLLLANPNIVWNAVTNSFYQYVNSTVSWASANTAAGAATLGGIAGHLAVITSAVENTYLYSLISNDAWIGATDSVSEGAWRWVGGMQDGLQFSQGGTAVNNFYTNWSAGEPNNFGGSENYASLKIANAQWNDTTAGTSLRYLIEWDAGLMSDDNVADTLSGGIGNDTIYAYGGADSVTAGDGNDIVIAATGNDTVTGGLGSDVLDGGSGTDTLDYSDSTNSVVVNLATSSITGSHASSSAFGDTITGFENITGSTSADALTGDGTANTISASGGNDTVTGGLGSDVLDGGTGTDTLDYSDSTNAVVVNLATSSITGSHASSSAFGDTITGFENITASTSADTLTGDGTANTISASGGNDIVMGGLGSDVLDGGTGTDMLDYSDSTNAITVNLATSSITGSHASSSAFGDTITGFENITATTSADTLTGSSSANTISASGGNDTVTGGLGSDVLDGGSGTDTLDYSDSTNSVVVNLATNSITGSHASSSASGDSITGFENITASTSADTLTGSSSANTISASGGDDIVTGGLGADILDGGSGTDTLNYSDNTNAIIVNLATNSITGSHASSSAFGDTITGFENITATTSADILTGSSSANTISASDGNDTVTGGLGSDILDGGAGTDILDYSDSTTSVFANLATGSTTGSDASSTAFGDTIANFELVVGGSGADTLIGTTSVNTLTGGDGNDSLGGGLGADSLMGGLGTDTVDYSDSLYAVTINLVTQSVTGSHTNSTAYGDVMTGFESVIGGIGNDTFTGSSADNAISGGDGTDTVIGGAGADTLDGGNGIDTLNYYDSTTSLVVNLATNSTSGSHASSMAFGDTIINFENVIGGSDADTLTGNSVANILSGLAGSDIISGGDGNDIITAGLGVDTLDGGDGTDTLNYADSTKSVRVNLVTQSLIGSHASSAAFGDSITGFESAIGGSDADILIGNNNDNVLTGSAGNDMIYGGLGTDTLDGGVGIDSLDYSSEANSVIINLTTGSTAGSHASSTAFGDTAINFENISGSSDADNFTGSISNNILSGLAGNDIMDGGNGNDTIQGGLGTDSLTGGLGSDTVDYSDSTTFIVVNLASHSIAGSHASSTAFGDTITGFENIQGGMGNDILIGTSAVNMIAGNGGDDIITGGAGADNFDGGDGFDILDFSDLAQGLTMVIGSSGGYATSNSEKDTFKGFEEYYLTAYADTVTGGKAGEVFAGSAGADTMDGAAGIDVVDYSTSTAVTLNFNTGGTISGGQATGDVLSNIENIIGSAQNDNIIGQTSGSAIDNIFYGEGGNDYIVGGTGKDTIYGGTGDDSLYGGTGDDFIYGGIGNNLSYGDAGNDVFFIEGTDIDIIDGGAGTSDMVDFSLATQAAMINMATYENLGSASNKSFTAIENMRGSDYDDTLTGDTKVNKIFGGLGSDTLLGGSGNDMLHGELGNDVMNGGIGNDLLVGGAGSDDITSGAGKDIFMYETVSESVTGTTDNILDFVVGQDVINIAKLTSDIAGFTDLNIALDTGTTYDVTDAVGSSFALKVTILGAGSLSATSFVFG